MRKIVIFFVILLLQISVASCANKKQSYTPNPKFDITLENLQTITESLPKSIRTKILTSPVCFLEYVYETLHYPKDLLILVDKTHGLSSNYIPPDLVELKKYSLTISKHYLKLRSIVMPDLLAMAESARNNGIEIVISSTYRSYAYQKRLYNYYVQKEGREKADRESARPGHSQHQLGTAIDFGNIDDSFLNTPQGKWLMKNAWLYGFSLSYPPGEEKITGYRFEPWHYRYVGREAAKLIKEYFDNSQQRFLEFYNKYKNFFKGRIKSN